MDQDIYALVGKYGFKSLHNRLTEIMKSEYEYLKGQFPLEVPVNRVVEPTLVPVQPPVQKEGKRKYTKKSQVQPPAQAVVVESPEIKDVVVVAPLNQNAYRDPKEVKAFQKAGEEERHKLNETAGLQLSQILTKENLKQWIEVDGHTYAWVAREKAGCPDTQVAATAQMMGIKSKISKKKALIMSKS
jgi:hypothetical protein